MTPKLLESSHIGSPRAPQIIPAGDRAYLIRFDDVISPEVHARVLNTVEEFELSRHPWLVDLVPAYASLLVIYDPVQVSTTEVEHAIGTAIENAAAATAARSPIEGRLVEIPVWYDPSVAPDLELLAAEKALTPAQVIQLHTAAEYRVYALGFRPGFAFLGTTDARLATPRLVTPRPRVPAGSVAIAGRQTGIYPAIGPGGWRIIGRTPVVLFDLARREPFYLRAGDRVRFRAIDKNDFHACGGLIGSAL